MRSIIYTLNEQGMPVPMKSGDRDDVLKWGRMMERNRIVKHTHCNGFFISTIFLGIDYAFQGPPVCWETMVFEETPEGVVCDYQDIASDRCAGGCEQAGRPRRRPALAESLGSS